MPSKGSRSHVDFVHIVVGMFFLNFLVDLLPYRIIRFKFGHNVFHLRNNVVATAGLHALIQAVEVLEHIFIEICPHTRNS